MDKWELWCWEEIDRISHIKNKVERYKQWMLYFEKLIMIYGSSSFGLAFVRRIR